MSQRMHDLSTEAKVPLQLAETHLVSVQFPGRVWKVGLAHAWVHDEALEACSQHVLAHEAALGRLTVPLS
jgi:hypothetical protein